VIGKDVPYPLLQAIAELDETALRTGLARLQEAEFLYEVQLFPELEHTFKHALTHEVAYGTLLKDRRRTIHAELVRAIEEIYTGRLDEQVEQLAHHAARGELWDKALTYGRQAGARAEARSAYAAAAAHFESALEALAHSPPSREAQMVQVDLLLNLRIALPLGELERLLEVSRRALSVAEALGDEKRLAHASAVMANALYVTGSPTEGFTLAERAVSLAERLGLIELQIRSRIFLAQVCMATGDYHRGIALLEVNREALGDDSTLRSGSTLLTAVFSHAWHALALAEVGEFARAATIAEEGARLVTNLDTPYNRLYALFGLSVSSIRRGNFGTAIPCLEQGLALMRQMTASVWWPAFASLLGYAYALSNRRTEGLALLHEASIQAETRLRVSRSQCLSRESEALLLVGRKDDARTAAACGLEGARACRERGDEAWCLRALGDAEAHGDEPNVTAAHAWYQQALALATELGMRPLVAHCHLGLGKLFRRTGKRREAQERLTTATTMYREMDMRFWLEQAEAEMKELV
jgi:tetratricopeptide (TPR) repeat protein